MIEKLQSIQPADKLPITRDYARGVVTGAFVLIFFGAFWASQAITHWPQVSPLAYGMFSLPVVALTLFAVMRFINVAKLPEAVDGHQVSRDSKRTGLAFGLIVVVEFILIAVVANILVKLNQPLLITVAIALIVGLHFFPLARLFGVPIYSVTGLLCVACAFASLLIADEALRIFVLGFAIAVVLWGTAGVVLLRYTGFKGRASVSVSLMLLTVSCAPVRNPAAVPTSVYAPMPTTIDRQALTIDFGDFQTKAELSFPTTSTGALPTVILIHGSGPEDIDGTIFSPSADGKPVKLSGIFKDLSDGLASKGFAVLRYNKHYVTGPGQYDAQVFYAKLDLNQMLKDAEKVLETAKANAHVDATHIYVYGWSEGSTVAAALVTKHPEVAGLILQAPVALSWRETFIYQALDVGLPYLKSFATDGKITDATVQKTLAGPGGLAAKGVVNYIADLATFQAGKVAINPQLDTNKNGALELETEVTPKVFENTIDVGFSSFFGIYAPGHALPTLIEAAPKLKLPVLILQGANDANVPARGANALESALKAAGNADVTLKAYPDLGHSLGLASSLSDDNFRPMANAPIEDLASWLREHTKR